MTDIGVKIQARNEFFINPTIPTRDFVRKANYSRRQAQLTSEGFFSKLWKPYVCIGHPLELDKALEISVSKPHEKKVSEVKSNNETQENNEINSNNDENIQILENMQNSKKPSEKLEQLNKNVKDEIKKSSLVNFNVRTGHSFFGIIQKERDGKIALAEEAKNLERWKSTTEIRPPLEDSDSDSEFQDGEELTSRPSTGVSKKKCNSRPFTPMYNNINSLSTRSSARPNSENHNDYNISTGRSALSSEDIKQESLYRQLTALHWLLEATINDNVDNMPRISLSWITRNENNNLTSAKNRREIKTAWERYVSKPSDQSAQQKNKATVSIIFQSNKPTTLPTNPKPKENDKIQEEQDDIKFLKVMKSYKRSSSAARSNSSSTRLNQSALALKRRQMMDLVKSVCDDIDKDNNDYEYKRNLHLLRIGRHPMENTRISKSTQLQPEDHFSDKLQLMLGKHRDLTNQIIDERITVLRENVRNMNEYKMTICQNKYKDIQVRGAFHHMLKNFRGKNTYQNFFATLDKSKNKIVYTDWFLSLEESLKEYMENKRIEKALESIRPYALITVTKLNRNRLISVLKHLSDWEIRHPDISASIKFITDHIIFMTEEEYQQWFNKNF